MRQTHEDTQPQSFVKFSFIGTSHLTPDEIRNFFTSFSITTDTVGLETCSGEESIIQECEFTLESVEWYDQEKQWEVEEEEERKKNS